MRTLRPITAVSPITTPVPWSTKNPSPISAAGWMSTPARGGGVDPPPGQRVGDPADDPRQQRRAEPVELMRQAVAHDRGDAGKAKDNLVDALRRRIVRESGADVLVEGGAYLRQCGGKQARDITGGSR